MPIGSDFSINATGDIRHISGTDVYSVLELHAWLQDLADDAASAGNDLVDILSPNPSRLDGPRDVAVASRLNLLSGGSVAFNIDDTASQYFNFGSIKQTNGDNQYSGIRTIGTIVAGSPMYLVQNGSKLTKFWSDGHIALLVKVKNAGSLIDSGNITVFSRKWGQTYAHFDVNLAAGGETNAALSTSIDSNIVLSEVNAALLSTKVSVTFGDTTQDLGNGNGPKLYKGTITLSNGCTVQEAYQYLQYLARENSTATLNGVPGWRYRALNGAYPETPTAPFGTFSGGKFFVAQGWFLTGALSAESTNYELIAHDGTTQVPPIIGIATISGLVAMSRVQIYNQTTATQIVNSISSGSTFTYTYNNGTGISAGDTIRIRATKLGCRPEAVLTTAASTGFSTLISQQADTVYVANGIDGATVTECTANYPNVQVDITDPDGVTSVKRIYAWLQYIQTTADGIAQWFDCISADDEANYRIDVGIVDLELYNLNPAPVRIIDGRLFRSDGSTIIAAASESIQLDPGRVYPTSVLINSVNDAVSAATAAKIAAQNTFAVSV